MAVAFNPAQGFSSIKLSSTAQPNIGRMYLMTALPLSSFDFFETSTHINFGLYLLKFNDFVDEYVKQHEYSQDDKKDLLNFLSTNLDRKRLLKAKEVLYNKDTGKILSIPSLIYNTGAKKFTLKRCDKRQSTLKSLAPKKNKNKKNDKIDINN